MAFYRKTVFPLLAGLLWLSFLTLDLTGLADSTWVKYAAICLCCGTAFAGCKTTDGKLVAAALCLTVAADWFLLVRRGASEIDQMLGIGLFIVVQLIYAFRLYCMRGRKVCKWGSVLRLSILAIACFLFPLAVFLFSHFLKHLAARFSVMDLVYLTASAGLFLLSMALFYFSNLFANMLEAFSLWPRLPRVYAFAWGLLLFLCCDICVGLANLGLFTDFTWWGSWLFYLPSQVLIVLSQELETGDLDEKRF